MIILARRELPEANKKRAKKCALHFQGEIGLQNKD
jgi:hypothetical protein